jgi:hypothetical protein
MTSVGHASEQALLAQDVRLAVDTIPTLAGQLVRTARLTSSIQRWLDYTGLSSEQARDWGWTVALHSDDLRVLVDYWQSILVAGEPGEIEAHLRRFDGV